MGPANAWSDWKIMHFHLSRKIQMLVAATVLSLLPAIAASSEFPIKEYEIGMNIKDYRFSYMCKKMTDGVSLCDDGAPGLTVGGEPINRVIIKFNSFDEAEGISMKFNVDSYEPIKLAIMNKYKKLKCSKSQTKNLTGAVLANEQCFISGKSESLLLQRFGDNLLTGVISITTRSELEKASIRKKLNESDI